MSDHDPIEIRPAKAEDLDAVAAIYNQGIRARNATFDEGHVAGLRYRPYLQESSRCALLVAVTGSSVVGWALLEPRSEREAYKVTGQIAVYVEESYRGQGIGMRLQLSLEPIALKLSYRSLISENLSSNPVSLIMDLKAGYHLIGEVQDAGFRDGQWIGLYILQKILGR